MELRPATLLYDGDCGLCVATAAWVGPRVPARRLRLVAQSDVGNEPFFDWRIGHLVLEPIYRQVARHRRAIGRLLRLPASCPMPTGDLRPR